MGVFNVHDAKIHLSRLLDRVAQGVAKLVRAPSAPRQPGRLKGRIRIGPNFDEPLPEEILMAFRGEGE
jgi:antitoxin (DNA-binding transcriptional repressor) of toxin-antitoxin stability system